MRCIESPGPAGSATPAPRRGAAAPHPHDHAPGADLLRPPSPVSSTAATGTPGAAGRLIDWMAQALGREREIVRKDPAQRSFQAQSKR